MRKKIIGGRTALNWYGIHILAHSDHKISLNLVKGGKIESVYIDFLKDGVYLIDPQTEEKIKINNPCHAKSNPAGSLRRALKLSEKFHGAPPRKIKNINIRWPKALVQIGSAAQVDYVSDKFDGKLRQYYHEFEKPALILTAEKPQADGENLLIIKGQFRITKNGIVG